MKLCVVIPAYKPGAPLVDLVRALAAASEVAAVVVVNDGSGGPFDQIFASVRDTAKTTILLHAVNLGKGAALKTGMNYCLATYRDETVVVTADADGQHLPADILAVAREAMRERGSLVLGAREFDRAVPLRSKFGNVLTRYVLRFAVGCSLRDTQTGLRGIPNALIPKLLKMTTGGYEFELDMLVLCKQMGIPIREVAIRTVYLEDNKSSHFDPLLDSMRIYFVLLRFTLASLATAVIDYTVFTTVMRSGEDVVHAQIAARAVALVFNYFTVKRLVFYSDQKHWAVFPRYIAVVILSGTVSYGFIRLLHEYLHMPVLAAKLCAETLIFVANFAVLREFIFSKREPAREAAPA
jgi:glycosyltransferase involved in cell wall biosynthesis